MSKTPLRCLVIGTSPQSLCEALIYKLKGYDVTLFESRATPGGAWRTIQIENFENLENGPHIIYPSRYTYHLLRNFFNIQLDTLNPKPIYFLSGNLMGLKTCSLRHRKLQASSTIIDFVAKKQLRDSVNLFSRLLNPNILASSLFLPHVQYPVGGSRELISKMIEKLKQHDIKIELNKRVNEIDIRVQENKVNVSTETELVHYDQVLLPEHAQINSLKVNGVQYQFLTQLKLWNQSFLAIEDPTPSKFSYITGIESRTHKHKLMRLSDSTRYCRPKLQNGIKTIFCDHRIPISDYNEIYKIFEFLKDNALIGPQANLTYSKTQTITQHQIDRQQIQGLDLPSSLFRVLHTTNSLSSWLHNFYKKNFLYQTINRF